MSFSSIYNRIFWKNRPNTSTALGATNLNKMDATLDTLDTRIVELDTSKLDLSVGNQMVKSVTFLNNTGMLTVTLLDGTVTNYDTAIEKIATNFRYDKDTQALILTLADGTTQSVDLSALITQYEFLNSETVTFSVDSAGKIGASVKDGSITEKKLQPNYLADVKTETGKAQAASASALEYADDANYDAKLAQSYAVGGSGIREGEDADNAKKYKELAEQIYNNMQSSEVTGVKGNSETTYRRGNVNLTAENIGALSVNGNAVSATKATQDGNGNNIANTYLYKTGDSANNTISFSSNDAANPTAWTDVSILASGEKHSSIFNKISKMFKNVRYIWKLLGNTDISGIGNGTITGAVSTLNNNLTTVDLQLDNAGTIQDVDGGSFQTLKIYQTGNMISIYGNYKITQSLGVYKLIFRMYKQYFPLRMTIGSCIRSNNSTIRQISIDTEGRIYLYPTDGTVPDTTGVYVFNLNYLI